MFWAAPWFLIKSDAHPDVLIISIHVQRRRGVESDGVALGGAAEHETLRPSKEEARNLIFGRDAPSWGRGRGFERLSSQDFSAEEALPRYSRRSHEAKPHPTEPKPVSRDYRKYMNHRQGRVGDICTKRRLA